jgi:hypothetical protein
VSNGERRRLFMIPKNICRKHILYAIKEIDRKGVFRSRESKKFQVFYNGKYYPPKYVISLANKYANGLELDPSEFSGGQEANKFLERMGFKIVESPPSMVFVKRSTLKKISSKNVSKHYERCPKCKRTIEIMLRKIYGNVKCNYKIETGTKPEDYKDSTLYPILEEIFSELQNLRGHKDFVRSRVLPPCDFFIPNHGFIVEFDESQHFTYCRKVALSKYPESLELGFDRKKWIKLCETINAKDNDPPYRDEQRAWYDTLRDFIPAIKGLRPTLRLFSQDFQWCSMDPEKPSDVKKFKAILEERGQEWEIEFKEDPDPFIARIIIHAREWDGEVQTVRKLLNEVCKKWPKDKKVKFTITCGGFIQFNWPKNISRKDIGDNKNPNSKAIDSLVEEAKKCVGNILDNNFCEKLRELTDYITLGVDSYKEKVSITRNYISQLHVELIFLVDLKANKFYWTGKSYPTPNQQHGLVRIPDLRTHFFELDDVGKVMILGCHDLTIFNPRSDVVASGWRKDLKEEFKCIVKKEDPIIALHHPHTTNCINVWTPAWNNLTKMISSIEKYASAGRWPHTKHHSYKEGERKDKPHCTLEDVLKKTKSGGTIDFILRKTF